MGIDKTTKSLQDMLAELNNTWALLDSMPTQYERPWWASPLPADMAAIQPLTAAGAVPGAGAESQAVQDARAEAMAILDVRTGMEQQYQEQLAIIQPLELANHALFLQAKAQLDKSYEDAKASMQRQAMAAQLGAAGQMFMSMGAKSIELFRFGQALSIVQAIMNTYEGATKAWAQGGMYGAIGAAVVVAAGLAQVAQIASQKPPTPPKAFAVGTPYVPMTGMALVHKGEKIIPADTPSDPWQGGGVTNNFDFSNLYVDSQERVNEIARKVAETHERGYVN
jgi:hypothetical protein